GAHRLAVTRLRRSRAWTRSPTQTATALLLPEHFHKPLFARSFLGLEVRFLEGELRPRTERYELGRTRRKDFFHQPCFCFRPHHKNLCQHRDHLFGSEQSNRHACRVDLSRRKTVIGSTTFARGMVTAF